jgi:hypothetical protein
VGFETGFGCHYSSSAPIKQAFIGVEVTDFCFCPQLKTAYTKQSTALVRTEYKWKSAGIFNPRLANQLL